jgi:hypothetical protein
VLLDRTKSYRSPAVLERVMNVSDLLVGGFGTGVVVVVVVVVVV